MSIKPQPRAAKIVVHEGAEGYTSIQMAKALGIDRSTLVRFEQRGIFPKAKWAGHPVNGRFYLPQDLPILRAKLLTHQTAIAEAQSLRDGSRELVVDPAVLPDPR